MLEGKINVRNAQSHDGKSEWAREIEIRDVHRSRPFRKLIGELSTAPDDFRGGNKQVARGRIKSSRQRRGTGRGTIRMRNADWSRREVDARLDYPSDHFTGEATVPRVIISHEQALGFANRFKNRVEVEGIQAANINDFHVNFSLAGAKISGAKRFDNAVRTGNDSNVRSFSRHATFIQRSAMI